jgi:hypothetical protein
VLSVPEVSLRAVEPDGGACAPPPADRGPRRPTTAGAASGARILIAVGDDPSPPLDQPSAHRGERADDRSLADHRDGGGPAEQEEVGLCILARRQSGLLARTSDEPAQDSGAQQSPSAAEDDATAECAAVEVYLMSSLQPGGYFDRRMGEIGSAHQGSSIGSVIFSRSG